MPLPGTMTFRVSQHNSTGRTELHGLSSPWVFISIYTLEKKTELKSNMAAVDLTGDWIF